VAFMKRRKQPALYRNALVDPTKQQATHNEKFVCGNAVLGAALATALTPPKAAKKRSKVAKKKATKK
jgi:hypothetical protein